MTEQPAGLPGRIGVARRSSVLFSVPLELPAAAPKASGEPAAKLCTRCASTMRRPAPLHGPGGSRREGRSLSHVAGRSAERRSGLATFSNVVRHHELRAARVPGSRCTRSTWRSWRASRSSFARLREAFQAINHKAYTLDASMCVIADAAQRPVAAGGWRWGRRRGGERAPTDLLIQAADFARVSIRSTASSACAAIRRIASNRGVDPQGVDWASRRACG